jgi:AAA domain
MFLQTALDLVTSGETEVVHQTIEALASEGGLNRIDEMVTTITAESSDQQCLHHGETMLLPFLKTITHPDATQSFILEKPMRIIHNYMYGAGGRRAVRVFMTATRFLLLFQASSALKSTALVGVLTSLHCIVELNSHAKVNQDLIVVVDKLANLLEDPMVQDSWEARRIFNRIHDRLREGDALPDVNALRKPPIVLPGLAFHDLDREQPGELSPKGPRHDNDHDDIQDISILPTASEIRSDRAEYLPPKDPRSLHLGGVEGLLDRHFRLLREDNIGPLRDIVRGELDLLQDPEFSASALSQAHQNFRRFAYKDIKLTQITFDRVGGLRAHVSFRQPKAALGKTDAVRRQWWESSKRLRPEGLLCLVDAAQNVTFYTVCGEEAGKDRQESYCSKLLYQDKERASVVVRLVEPLQLDIQRLVKSFCDPTSGAHTLCELPGVLLPSFYPTLKALQKMSATLDLPFAEILAPADTRHDTGEIGPPSYAERSGFRYDLKSLVGGEHLELSLGQTFNYATLAAKSLLDEAQQTAVVNALTRQVALVQGPPGTGKSFAGVALIKALLDNAEKARLGPVVCVCYTNHALDQLLEHLLKDNVTGIIRIGSRSKSEVVKRLNLRDAAQAGERTQVQRRRFAIHKSGLENEAENAKPLLDNLVQSDRPQAVKEFLQRTNPAQYRQLYGKQEDEDGFQVVDYDSREALNKWLHPRSSKAAQPNGGPWNATRTIEQLENSSIWSMNPHERKRLYTHWTEKLQDDALEDLSFIFSIVNEHVQEMEQCRKEDDLQVLTRAKVIGVTTSGLARNLDVLRRLQSKVLLCEEAGEVLEAHLLTACLPSIEHAILIGDHEQLKPQIANYDLSSENPRGVQYSLDVSLFERLLQPNLPYAAAIPYSTLRIQRRMHPSISRLIRNTIYPRLVDHDSVNEYPEVEGMRNRLFWLDHEHPENNTERQESTSHSNEFEVQMVAALVHHLVRQSRYHSEDIAVLTPYLGQLAKLRNKLASSFEIVVGDRDQEGLEKEGLEVGPQDHIQHSVVRKTSLSKAVRIASVDNFQVANVSYSSWLCANYLT